MFSKRFYPILYDSNDYKKAPARFYELGIAIFAHEMHFCAAEMHFCAAETHFFAAEMHFCAAEMHFCTAEMHFLHAKRIFCTRNAFFDT